MVAHLPHDKLQAYSTLAVQSDYLADLSDVELDQWTTLSTLTGPGRRFSDVEAETLRITLSKARFSADKMLRTSRIALTRVRATGLIDPASFHGAAANAAALVPDQPMIWRTCSRSGPDLSPAIFLSPPPEPARQCVTVRWLRNLRAPQSPWPTA